MPSLQFPIQRSVSHSPSPNTNDYVNSRRSRSNSTNSTPRLASNLHSVNNAPNTARASLYNTSRQAIPTAQTFNKPRVPLNVDYSALSHGDPAHNGEPYKDEEIDGLKRVLSYEGKNNYSLAAHPVNGKKLRVVPPPSTDTAAPDFLVYQRTDSDGHEKLLYSFDHMQTYHNNADDKAKKRYFGHSGNQNPTFPKHTDGKSKKAYDAHHNREIPTIAILDKRKLNPERRISFDGRIEKHLRMEDNNPTIDKRLKDMPADQHKFFISLSTNPESKSTVVDPNVTRADIQTFLRDNQ